MKISIIGCGIAGCTAALELSKNKKNKIILYEKKNTILGNAPYCRLHCGLMYPMISFKESELLLMYSIEFAREFRSAILKRPCVIMYNKKSNYITRELIDKCEFIQRKYKKFNDFTMGHPDTYFAVYTRNDMISFKQFGKFLHSTSEARKFHDPFVKTVCRMIKDIDSIKYPFVSVNEFGIAQDIVEKLIKRRINSASNIKLKLNTTYDSGTLKNIINAKGSFTTNAGFLELKSSWLVKLQQKESLPEIAIIGERETDHSMIQISPRKYKNVQLHYMSYNSTLFERVHKFENFSLENQEIIKNNYIPKDITITRTNNAINQIKKFLDIQFQTCNYKALWGCQFIPSLDSSTRTCTFNINITNSEINIEIVKAISSVYTAKQISYLNCFKIK